MLARALHDDPFATWFVPDPRRRARTLRLIEWAILIDCQRHGEVRGAFSHGQLLGVTAWLAPGAHRPGVIRRLRQSPQLIRALASVPGRAGDAFRVAEAERHIHPDEAHWWLVVVGVDPSHQGTGVGSVMVESLVSRADTEGAPTYLRTTNEANLAFYARFGFEVRDEVRSVPSAPPMWLLWRKPKA